MPRINAATIDEHRSATRRALLGGAHDLFGRVGYADTTLTDISDHAGIGRTTFYDYFTSKEDLLACMVEEALPEVFGTLIAEIPGTLAYRDQLSALVVSMVEFVVSDPVFGLVLHQDVPRLGPDAQRRIAASHQNLVTEFARIYLGVDPIREQVPVQPTAHYAMGGIPTTIDTHVISDGANTIVPGLYAAGEVGCVSLHGANRLGTNSLGDLIVFGRRAGINAAAYAAGADYPALPSDPQQRARDLVERTRNGPRSERVSHIRSELQNTMMANASVFRTEETLSEQVGIVRELQERVAHIGVEDEGRQYNTELLEAIELGFLLDNAEQLVHAALNRKESRGAHSREDYRERDDDSWLKHTLVYRDDGGVRIDYKPVTLGKYEPKPRVY